jgi:hypothetical protein
MATKLSEFQLPDDQREIKGTLESKHSTTIYPLQAEGRTVYLREPSPAEMECYMDEQLDDELRGKAAINLFKSCWVHPEKQSERAAMFAPRPGLMIAFALSFLKVAGIRAEVLQGK